MIIRKAEISDSADIQVLSKELGYSSTLNQIEERIRYLSSKQKCFLLVASENNTIKGFISYEHYEPVYFESGIHITGLVVKEEYRGRGVGRSLLNYVKEYAIKNNLKYLRLNSGSQRIEAHQFYRNYGFDNEKDQKRFIMSL